MTPAGNKNVTSIDQGRPRRRRPDREFVAQAGRLLGDGEGRIPELLHELLSPDVTAARICRLLASDVALSARVLKVANSAWYGQHRNISSIDRAIVVLGLSVLRRLVLAASCLRIRRTRQAPGLPDSGAVIAHSLAVAIGAQLLAAEQGDTDPETAFVAGLLHDFGLLVEFSMEAEGLGADLTTPGQATIGGTPEAWLSRERQHFGWDHTDLGAALLESWQIPENVVYSTEWHHQPTHAPHSAKRLSALVALGDALAGNIGMGLTLFSEPEEPAPCVLEALGFDWEERCEWQQRMADELRPYASLGA
ncbi:MAG: HDOD domain-containing protein [Chromatiales bacterium]|nr:HDOD domain-containing protein [Chromatiales bacterium]